MSCTGRSLGRFVLRENGDLVLEEIGPEGKTYQSFQIECDDLKTAKHLTEATDEPLLIDYELIDNQSVRILQAVRRPEENIRQMRFCFYISERAFRYNMKPSIGNVYLVTSRFIENKAWEIVDKAAEFEDFIDESGYEVENPLSWLSNLCIELKLPPQQLYFFKSFPQEFKGKVMRPISGTGNLECDLSNYSNFDPGELLTGVKISPDAEIMWIPKEEFFSRPEVLQLPAEEQQADPEVVRRKVPPSLRRKVFMRDGFRCVDCGANPSTDPFVTLEADHRIPVSKGGKTTLGNLQTLCWACNRGKGANYDHKLGDDPWASTAAL